MQLSPFDLTNLLTAAGVAMGASNQRLMAAGAPALLREFTMTLSFSAGFQVLTGGGTVTFTQVSLSAPSGGTASGNNVTVSATYMAVPSISSGSGGAAATPAVQGGAGVL